MYRIRGFQARSRGWRWSWTLKLAQKRSWAGRWSWAAKVGLLSLRVVPQQQCRATDIVLVTVQARQLKQQIAPRTSRFAMARGHRLHTSIVLAAVHGLSGLFRAVSAVEPSLFCPLRIVTSCCRDVPASAVGFSDWLSVLSVTLFRSADAGQSVSSVFAGRSGQTSYLIRTESQSTSHHHPASVDVKQLSYSFSVDVMQNCTLTYLLTRLTDSSSFVTAGPRSSRGSTQAWPSSQVTYPWLTSQARSVATTGRISQSVAHSEHRFPAPSLKEGCRKPVLEVCHSVSGSPYD